MDNANMENFQEIEKIALKLPVNERELLANHLFQSVHDGEINEIDAAWLEEADKRYKDFLKDPSTGISHKKIFNEIKSELKWK